VNELLLKTLNELDEMGDQIEQVYVNYSGVFIILLTRCPDEEGNIFFIVRGERGSAEAVAWMHTYESATAEFKYYGHQIDSYPPSITCEPIDSGGE